MDRNHMMVRWKSWEKQVGKVTERQMDQVSAVSVSFFKCVAPSAIHLSFVVIVRHLDSRAFLMAMASSGADEIVPWRQHGT